MDILVYIYIAGFCYSMFSERVVIKIYEKDGMSAPCPVWASFLHCLFWPLQVPLTNTVALYFAYKWWLNNRSGK